jgi:putative transposase
MLKAYKYRIYPTIDQQKKIDHTIDVCRLVYNLALEVNIRAYKEHGVKISSFGLCYQLVPLKKEFPWIAEVDSQALQASVKKIDAAFKNFYRGNGYPKFKSKKNDVQSFQCPKGSRKVNWINSTITIPKIQGIPAKLSRRFEGKIKTCTVRKTATGKYYVTILVENGIEFTVKRPISPETTIGLDLGISSYVVSSNGMIFEPNRFLKKKLKRLQCLQRRASRKVKGSKNREKANKCVAILHEKITNQRTDYIHKITTGLIRDNQTDTIVIEDLNIVGMLKNRNLSQAIFDISMGEFYRQLGYKCEWYGINLIKIGRFDPSSKRCSDCGEINKELTLDNREWVCQCGSVHDRDFNAAKNIKWFGLNNSRRGTSSEPVELSAECEAEKQEYMAINQIVTKERIN